MGLNVSIVMYRFIITQYLNSSSMQVFFNFLHTIDNQKKWCSFLDILEFYCEGFVPIEVLGYTPLPPREHCKQVLAKGQGSWLHL